MAYPTSAACADGVRSSGSVMGTDASIAIRATICLPTISAASRSCLRRDLTLAMA